MDIKPKVGIYISCFGVSISVCLVVFQLQVSHPSVSGLGVLVGNILILIGNIVRYKKQTAKSKTLV